MGSSFYTEKSTPPAHRTGLFRPTTALPTPPVGVPASPWMWAKARSKLGALVRLCGDGAVSNDEAKWGHFTRKKAPLLHTEPGCSDPPPHSRRPPLTFPPRPGCGRRPEANWVHWFACAETGRCQMRRNGVILHGKKHPSCTQNRAVPTHHRTPDAPRWRSRLALDVGEGQKQTGCIGSPVRRRGGVE
jgi:hypothetical protein